MRGISLPNIDILDIEELEDKKHHAFTMLVEMSEKEANTIDISSRTFDYTISANEEMFRKFQDEKFVHAYKKVYQNPENNTIKDFLQEDMKKNILSLLSYRKNQIRAISKAEESVKGAVEKIVRLNTIPELYADLAIKEAANDMIFEQAIAKGEKNEDKNIAIQETSFFSKIKAGIRRWF